MLEIFVILFVLFWLIWIPMSYVIVWKAFFSKNDREL